MKTAIFFDRDGVLNEAIIKDQNPHAPWRLSELVIFADAQSALNNLKLAGFFLIGATNQPDVIRGRTSRSTVEAINAKLMAELPLDEIRVCYHDDSDQCACRKPLPGLLIQAAKDYGLDLLHCFMIGDRWQDIEAGKNAGCKTIWLENDYEKLPLPRPADFTATSLTEAANYILNTQNNGQKLNK